MKIKDFISKSIQEYPLLYKDVDYEKSKLKVLDQLFFVSGNGMEWADTKNPNEGGYLCKPKFKFDKKSNTWVKLKDKPYGKERYKKIPNDYFQHCVFYASGHPFVTMRTDNKNVVLRYKSCDTEPLPPRLILAESKHPFNPYPFDERKLAWALEKSQFIQPDWLQEFIYLCNFTLKYFNDESQYVNHSHYPKQWQSGHAIESNLNLVQTHVKHNPIQQWEKFRFEQIELLERILNKK
jgi:hypothetical protein